MKLNKKLIIVILCAGISTFSFAEIYRWVDDQGNVEFSDEAREGSEKIEVGPTATISLPKPDDVERLSTTTEGPTEQALLYSKLAITFPADNSAFNSGNGDVTVTMVVEPSLFPNHSLRLTLDGKQIATTKSDFHTFPNVDRGTHYLQLDIIDNTSVVMSGPSVSFTIHRPSILRKN
jgi:hypothetical protein